jgi:hypothetical protein
MPGEDERKSILLEQYGYLAYEAKMAGLIWKKHLDTIDELAGEFEIELTDKEKADALALETKLREE